MNTESTKEERDKRKHSERNRGRDSKSEQQTGRETQRETERQTDRQTDRDRDRERGKETLTTQAKRNGGWTPDSDHDQSHIRGCLYLFAANLPTPQYRIPSVDSRQQNLNLHIYLHVEN